MRKLILIAAAGVLVAIAFLVSRAPRMVESVAPSASIDSARAVTSLPVPPEEPAAHESRDRDVLAGAAPPVARISATPPAVEELKSRYPDTRGPLEYVEGAFARENRDPQWAAPMEAHILDEISQKALGLEITQLDVECRTTLCRLQFVFPQELARKNFGIVPIGTVWTGEQPIAFFLEVLDQ
ncbi:MAG TPA: hypothetical protein VIC71_05980 [Gammaproteobacteria bacterium]